jgi:NAD(P)-dependent dehydrogenase (short-subunit alcohol dehydrogenase family)
MAEILSNRPLNMDKSGMKPTTLAGEVALVTGGAGTIGLALSRCLAWLGAKVVICGRNPQTGEAAAELVNRENRPGTALFVRTDVSDPASVANLARQANETFGKVDILVNNAMDMSQGANILKTSVEAMDKQYAVAVRGALLGIQAFVPGMQQRKHGVVAYVATTFRYPSGPSNYCAAKAATSSMMMSLAAELGPSKDSGIGVFMFIPTLVRVPAPPDPNRPPPGFVSMPTVIGFGMSMPPEDCGAALSYCIVHAQEIHGSGVNAGQAHKRMHWPFPKPEYVPPKDYDRIRNQVEVRMFGYIGNGWPDAIEPLVTVDRSKAPPNELLNISALYEK